MTTESPDLTWKALGSNVVQNKWERSYANYVAMENYFFDYSMLQQSLV